MIKRCKGSRVQIAPGASMKSANITYFVHGTTIDNEKGVATGQAPGELSELGIKQSRELGETIKNKKFDAIFSSDLKRAVDSVRLMFPKAKIIKDKRLRECDYGDMTGTASKKIESADIACIDEPFSNGESYQDVEKRIRNFLKDLLGKHSGKKVAIVAHRAPQLALDVIVKGKSWKQAMKEDWRPKKQWKPGWEYMVEEKMLK